MPEPVNKVVGSFSSTSGAGAGAAGIGEDAAVAGGGVQAVLNGHRYQATAFAEKVAELYAKSSGKENPQGWIIAALREIFDGS